MTPIVIMLTLLGILFGHGVAAAARDRDAATRRNIAIHGGKFGPYRSPRR